MPSHKTFKTKQKLAKAQKANRPIPQWIRLRTNNTIRYDAMMKGNKKGAVQGGQQRFSYSGKRGLRISEYSLLHSISF
ncbi:60S ribosomal protein L39-like protein [Cercophora scortea]|uniref:Large ribosomal subunit protein eL39 n=1 Tax=Cercophora scortea TaxID=314031 RepID=A0AAE0IYH4_9PEZI|nr:60S ribosomal protein L39-like protein [Cercophora scortea]